jgi:hypothetical protein
VRDAEDAEDADDASARFVASPSSTSGRPIHPVCDADGASTVVVACNLERYGASAGDRASLRATCDILATSARCGMAVVGTTMTSTSPPRAWPRDESASKGGPRV